jgi:MFS family permease
LGLRKAVTTVSRPDPPASDWTARSVYVLGLLTLISSFNYLDRSVLGLVLPLIKREMQLSDSVLGLVSGFAFALFYSALGLPIASLADRSNRRNIIGFGLAFWSLMTALTGIVSTVGQLALARFLMGAGEACCVAPANSMLSDLFGRARRPLAVAVFTCASSLASLLYFPLAGWISDRYGWRATFIAAGAPGLLLAAILFLTVREPARGLTDGGRQPPERAGLAETLRFLAGSRAYRWVALGCVFMGADIYAGSAWSMTFLVRVHHLNLTEIGSVVGPVRGILGAVGILSGGVLAGWLGRRDERWRLWVPAAACLLVAPSECLFLFGDAEPVWLLGLVGSSLFTIMHQGPIYAVCMNVARPRMRAVAASALILGASFFGQIIGPLLVGRLNDWLDPAFGQMAIRYSLTVMVVVSLAGGLCFLAAARFIEADTQRAVPA